MRKVGDEQEVVRKVGFSHFPLAAVRQISNLSEGKKGNPQRKNDLSECQPAGKNGIEVST